jgi:ABC-type antimicrobial peptide transport system permease subunit
MSEKDSKGSGGVPGISFLGLLAILFIGLKLTGYIDWHWAWVLSPLWIPIAAVLGILAIILCGWFTWKVIELTGAVLDHIRR